MSQFGDYLNIRCHDLFLLLMNIHANRDLQPHNVLLGDRGHILLTFISQWNCVDINLDMDAKDNLYSAPGEIYITLPVN